MLHSYLALVLGFKLGGQNKTTILKIASQTAPILLKLGGLSTFVTDQGSWPSLIDRN